MKTIRTNLLVVGALALIGAQHAMATTVTTPSDGDIFIGFRATSGQGAATSYLVNIGSDSTFNAASSGATSVGNLNADLTAIFGSNWSSRSDVLWGVFGARNNVNPTVYGTRAQAPFGTVAPTYPTLDLTARSGTTSQIVSVISAYSGLDATANNPKAATQNNSTAASSYAAQVGTAGTTDFGSLSGWTSIEDSFGAGAASSALDFFRFAFVSGSNAVQRLGTFSISTAGALTFTTKTVAVQNANVSVQENAGSASVTFTRSGDASIPFTATYSVTAGTALAGTDYTVPSTLTVGFLAGDLTKTVTIPVINRPGYFGTRSFNVSLVSATGGLQVGAAASTAVAISDVDPSVPAGAIDFASPFITASRGATSVTINLARSGGVPATSAVVTASAGVTGSATATFGVGINTSSVTLAVPANTSITGTQFTVSLSGFTAGASAGTTNPTATVILPGIETSPPSLTVTSPIATAAVIGNTIAGNVTITGQADDDIGVSAVLVKVNNGPFTPLSLSPPALLPGNKQNFSQSLTGVLDVINGLNTVTVRAIDSSGNTTDIVRNVRYTAKHNIAVTATGNVAAVTFVGALADPVSPLNPGAYTIGNLYTITAPQFDTGTAVPTDASKVFSYWTVGSSVTHISTRALSFVATTDLITNPSIVAHYVTNPFAANVISGTYAGLVTNNSGYASSNATNGFITATVTAKGALTGSIKINGGLLTFVSGNVANDGSVLFGVSPVLPYARFVSAGTGLTVTLQFDFANKQLNGTLYSAVNVSTITARLQASSTAASYTLHAPKSSVPAGNAFPQGDSIGNFSVTSAGVVSGSLTLADTKIASFSSFVSSAGTFPVYVSPYGAVAGTTAGSFSGLVTIAANATGDLSATVKWFRPAAATGLSTYPSGWPTGVTVSIAGGVYNSAASPLYTGAGAGNNATFDGTGTAFAGTTKVVDVSGVTFTKHTATDKSFTIVSTAVPYVSGTINGYLYKGVVIQNGATPGVYGYFSTGTTTAAGAQGLFTLH